MQLASIESVFFPPLWCRLYHFSSHHRGAATIFEKSILVCSQQPMPHVVVAIAASTSVNAPEKAGMRDYPTAAFVPAKDDSETTESKPLIKPIAVLQHFAAFQCMIRASCTSCAVAVSQQLQLDS